MNSLEIIESLSRFQQENGSLPLDVEVSVDATDLILAAGAENGRRIFGSVDSIQFNGGSISLLVFDPEPNF
jgi:hypothetical protein